MFVSLWLVGSCNIIYKVDLPAQLSPVLPNINLAQPVTLHMYNDDTLLRQQWLVLRQQWLVMAYNHHHNFRFKIWCLSR